MAKEAGTDTSRFFWVSHYTVFKLKNAETMKKGFVLIIITIWAMTSFSQDYYPLIEENRSWNVIEATLDGGWPWTVTYSTITYKLIGDTIIDAKSYFKLYESHDKNPATWNLWRYMREDNEKKIWFRMNSDDDEVLMYDFGVQQGDTVYVGLEVAWEVPLTVDSIGTIEINGSGRTIVYLSDLYLDYSETWIEGIGSSKGICWSGSSDIVGGWYEYLCMSDDDELVYRNPNYGSCYLITEVAELNSPSFRIYPNPSMEQFTIENTHSLEIQSITLCGVNGQIIRRFEASDIQYDVSGIPSGLYFLKLLCGNGEFTKKIVIE